jgi:hypothetical protein
MASATGSTVNNITYSVKLEHSPHSTSSAYLFLTSQGNTATGIRRYGVIIDQVSIPDDEGIVLVELTVHQELPSHTENARKRGNHLGEYK